MSFQSKSLQCSDCGANFTFSAEEQEFFQSRGYTNEPKRCPECRQARKSERYGCSPRYVLSVVRIPKYPLNLAVTDPFTVAIAIVK
jgi:NAD-dependent SIR2 family protein deacetylase